MKDEIADKVGEKLYAMLSDFAKEVIESKGVLFDEVEVLPDDIQRGEVGECFDNAALAAFQSNGKYLYVEGYAYVAKEDKWYYHSWLTPADTVDSEKHIAYDPTWLARDNAGVEQKLSDAGILYIDVPVRDFKKVLPFVLKNEKLAILEHYKLNEPLAREIFS